MKRLLLLATILVPLTVFAQSKDEASIRTVLNRQTAAWNKGDLPGYMQGYWHSDSLMFIGKSGIQWGWRKTLENYQKGYPDTASMGKLSFELLQVRRLSPYYFYIVGKWHLARSKGDIGGHFDLLFRRIKGRWLIVSDHSS